MPENTAPIAYTCLQCGGTDVSRDAWAEWNTAAQCWALRAVFDDGFCHDCDEGVTLVERPVANP